MTVTGTFDVITDWEADVIPSPAGGLALALQWGPLAHAVSPGGWGRSRDPHLWGTDTWTHTYGARMLESGGGRHPGTHTYGVQTPGPTLVGHRRWGLWGEGVGGGPGPHTYGARMPGPTLMGPKHLGSSPLPLFLPPRSMPLSLRPTAARRRSPDRPHPPSPSPVGQGLYKSHPPIKEAEPSASC